jgi:hypothetical protein
MHGWVIFEPSIKFSEGQSECPVHLTVTVDGMIWGQFDETLKNPSEWELVPTGSWGQWDLTVPNYYKMENPFGTQLTQGKLYDLLCHGSWVIDCSNYDNWWSPLTEPVSMSIIEGNEYAWFQHGYEGSERLSYISGLQYSVDFFYSYLRVSRVIPDSINAFFVLQTDAGNLHSIDTVYISPPDTLFVTFDPPEITPGDTAVIHLQKRVDGNLEDVTEYFEIGIAEGNDYGTLLRADGDTSDYYPSENIRENDIRFISSKEIKGDSVATTVRVGFYKSNEPADAIREVPRQSGIRWMGKEMPRNNSSVKHQFEIQKSISEVTPEFQYPETGRGKIVISKRSILLGETKYYYATEENDELKIHETTDPTQNPGLSDITFCDPVAAQGSEKNPVYWEDQYPTYSGNIFTGSNSLPKGMLRLVGRYWEDGKTYKTKLTANKASDGKTDLIEIEVKKPDSLGNTHRTAIDVFGNSFNLDSIIIVYAGKYGIPPQFIKGDIQAESNAFNPSYRWEPFYDAWRIQKNAGKDGTSIYFTDDFQYRIKSSSDKGHPEIPTDHTNLYDGVGRISAYPGYVGTIWEEFYKYCSVVNPGAIKNLYPEYGADGDTLWYTYPAKTWDTKFKDTKKTLLKDENLTDGQKEATARDTANNWLRYQWQKGIMNTGIAQTRTASSYGLLQMMYPTAHGGRNYPINDNHLPEYLNITDTNFYYAVPFMEMQLEAELAGFTNKTSNWTNGFEMTFLRAYDRYNGATENSGNIGKKGYGKAVLRYSRNYLPKKK